MIPVIMRGQFYNTPLTARCAVFNECSICHGCTKYNRNEVACVQCESGHKKTLICQHTVEQRITMKRITDTIGPMFDINGARPGSVSKANYDENNEVVKLADSVRISEK